MFLAFYSFTVRLWNMDFSCNHDLLLSIDVITFAPLRAHRVGRTQSRGCPNRHRLVATCPLSVHHAPFRGLRRCGSCTNDDLCRSASNMPPFDNYSSALHGLAQHPSLLCFGLLIHLLVIFLSSVVGACIKEISGMEHAIRPTVQAAIRCLRSQENAAVELYRSFVQVYRF
jgi:hypothetical protein